MMSDSRTGETRAPPVRHAPLDGGRRECHRARAGNGGLALPPTSGVRERSAVGLVVLAVAVFWVVSVLAGEQSAGYNLVNDTLSALAARGVDARDLGLAAGAALAFAHAAAAVLLPRLGAPRVAVAMAATALAGFALLAFPISCPGGAAGCSGPLSGRGPQGVDGVLHRDVATLYGALFVITMGSWAAALVRRGRAPTAAVFVLGTLLGAGCALQIRTGSLLGVWERGWLAANTVLLLGLAALSGGWVRRRPTLLGAAKLLALLGLATFAALLPIAIEAQPVFRVRDDLASDLAAHGAVAPALGQAFIVALALAHGGVAAALLVRRLRIAGAAGAVAAVSLLAIAFVQITCPRGASGCSGPDSGRVMPRPIADIVHRDLVAVLELGSVVLAVAVGVHLLRTSRRGLGTGTLLAAVASLVLLGGQQSGRDIGWWQLGWITATCVIVLAAVSGASPNQATQSPGAAMHGHRDANGSPLRHLSR